MTDIKLEKTNKPNIFIFRGSSKYPEPTYHDIDVGKELRGQPLSIRDTVDGFNQLLEQFPMFDDMQFTFNSNLQIKNLLLVTNKIESLELLYNITYYTESKPQVSNESN